MARKKQKKRAEVDAFIDLDLVNPLCKQCGKSCGDSYLCDKCTDKPKEVVRAADPLRAVEGAGQGVELFLPANEGSPQADIDAEPKKNDDLDFIDTPFTWLFYKFSIAFQVVASLSIWVLAFDAVLTIVGIGGAATGLAGMIATITAGAFFAQDGFSLRKKLRSWGESLDKLTWDKFFKEYALRIAYAFVIVVCVITFTSLIVFPPASMVLPVAFVLAKIGLSGLSIPALLLVVGGISSAVGYIFHKIPDLIKYTFNQLKQLYKKHIRKDHKSEKKDDESEEVQEKKSWKDNIWQALFFKFAGIPAALVGSIAAAALSYSAFSLFVGTGTIAAVIAGVVAGVAGLAYFCQDGNSLRKRLKKLGEALDKLDLKEWLYAHKWDIAIGILTVAAMATAACLIAFPPAAIAGYLAAGIAYLSLTGVSTPVLASLAAGVAFLVCNLTSTILKGTCNLIKAIWHKARSKKTTEVVNEEEVVQSEDVADASAKKEQSSFARMFKRLGKKVEPAAVAEEEKVVQIDIPPVSVPIGISPVSYHSPPAENLVGSMQRAGLFIGAGSGSSNQVKYDGIPARRAFTG